VGKVAQILETAGIENTYYEAKENGDSPMIVTENHQFLFGEETVAVTFTKETQVAYDENCVAKLLAMITVDLV